MRTIRNTPTSPKDYAILSVVYASAVGMLSLRMSRRDDGHERLPLSELVWTSAATFALAQTIVHDKVEVWIRQPFLDETGDDQFDAERTPRGSGMRFAIGELLSCTRCSGAWASLALNGLLIVSPATGRVATRVLAGAAVNDLLEVAFAWGRGEANLISEASKAA